MARGLGIALLPQAGVAIGMALVVSDRLPELGPSVLGATVASTIVFELVGPILTRRALDRFGEIELPAIREDAGQQTAIDDMA